MRYAVYGVLVLVGCGGLLVGLDRLSARQPGVEGVFWLLIGSVALGAIAIVMAIEHATSVQTRTLREMLIYQQRRDQPRLAVGDAAADRGE